MASRIGIGFFDTIMDSDVGMREGGELVTALHIGALDACRKLSADFGPDNFFVFPVCHSSQDDWVVRQLRETGIWRGSKLREDNLRFVRSLDDLCRSLTKLGGLTGFIDNNFVTLARLEGLAQHRLLLGPSYSRRERTTEGITHVADWKAAMTQIRTW